VGEVELLLHVSAASIAA